jgi:dienelactone hydrolase
MSRRSGLTASLCLVSVIGFAQAPDRGDLPRRAWFGVALAPHESGAVVTAVVDGSSAAADGIRVGDVIRAVDGVAPRSPDDVVAAVVRHAAGETAVIDMVREGVAQKRSVVLRSFPRETMVGVTFEYGAVGLPDGSRLRTILSVPERRESRLPAVLLLQGGGCGSVDTPMAADVGQSGLVRTIAARGFVTMRVDKSGLGDSQGPPCTEIGYAQERDGYRAALAALKRHPSVDPDRVYLLGISLGGVFAPLVASESRVRGVVVYGTLVTPPAGYPGRSNRFFREFASVDVAAAWSAVDARVLVLRGEFDETARESDHARIAAIVNARRPGAAIHRELRGLDHGWTRHDTMDKSRGNAGKGDAVTTLPDAILEFLRKDA